MSGRGLEVVFVTRQAGGELVNVVGMDDLHVLGLQGVGDCACNQGGDEHGG